MFYRSTKHIYIENHFIIGVLEQNAESPRYDMQITSKISMLCLTILDVIDAIA